MPGTRPVREDGRLFKCERDSDLKEGNTGREKDRQVMIEVLQL